MITLYGIKNCDTVKKAMRWLKENNVSYRFHNFREEDIDQQQVSQWIDQLGWEQVINKRSTSWKQLDETTRNTMDKTSAVNAILNNPTLVKRPLLDNNGTYMTGFKAENYATIF